MLSKFEATCNVKGCVMSLEEHFESVLPANDAEILDMSTDQGKAFKKNKVQNTFMMSYSKLRLYLPILLEMIQVSKDLEWPGELACDIKTSLMKKQMPDDVLVLDEMTTKLSKFELVKRQDPEELENEIVGIENEYWCTINGSIRNAFVVKTGGKQYADVI